jgi:hypothetical protein
LRQLFFVHEEDVLGSAQALPRLAGRCASGTVVIVGRSVYQSVLGNVVVSSILLAASCVDTNTRSSSSSRAQQTIDGGRSGGRLLLHVLHGVGGRHKFNNFAKLVLPSLLTCDLCVSEFARAAVFLGQHIMYRTTLGTERTVVMLLVVVHFFVARTGILVWSVFVVAVVGHCAVSYEDTVSETAIPLPSFLLSFLPDQPVRDQVLRDVGRHIPLASSAGHFRNCNYKKRKRRRRKRMTTGKMSVGCGKLLSRNDDERKLDQPLFSFLSCLLLKASS